MHHQQTLAGLGQVTDDFLGARVDHSGTDRNTQLQILTLATGAIRTAAIRATLGVKVTGVTVVNQGVEVFVGDHVDRAAITTITTVRTTVFDELLTTETHATVTTVACFYFDRYFIYKLHNKTRLSSSGRADKNQDIRLLQK